jgi:heterodisulfide reductase subunit C
MDYSPRRLINLAKEGFKDEVLSSFTIWLCASCYACATECPKQVKITDVMYALKRRAIKEGVYPKRFPIPTLAKEFFKMATSKGRVTETMLAFRIFGKTNFLKFFGMSWLGLNLVRTGRFSLKSEKIEHRKELQSIVQHIYPAKE